MLCGWIGQRWALFLDFHLDHAGSPGLIVFQILLQLNSNMCQKKLNNISMITILRGNHYEIPHKYTTMANSLTPIPTQCHLLYRSLPIGETKSTTSLQVNSCTLTKFMQQIARWTLKLKVDCKAHFLLKSKWVSIRYGFLHDILTLPTYCVVGNLITEVLANNSLVQ